MNKQTRASDLTLPKVTTGPLPASTKIYDAPDGHADVRVPFREIALSEGEAPPGLDLLAGESAGAAGGYEELEMRDGHAGALRQARLGNGRLTDCLILTRGGKLPPRDWLASLLLADEIDETTRRVFLSGRAGEGAADSRLVCACMGVRSDAILAAIAKGACNAASVGVQTGAGTNCGSCRSEIRSLIERVETEEAA